MKIRHIKSFKFQIDIAKSLQITKFMINNRTVERTVETIKNLIKTNH